MTLPLPRTGVGAAEGTPLSYGVRRLGPNEVGMLRALNALFGEVFDERETYSGSPPENAYCLGLLERDEVLLLVALEGERVIGGLAAYMLRKFEQERSEIYIYDLAVAEEHRRKGVATALIGEVRRIGRERGAWTIFVQADTQPEDEPAIALYRKLASEEITALHFDIAP
jgi:aminoglycoside 3-N-acetyltransferase I